MLKSYKLWAFYCLILPLAVGVQVSPDSSVTSFKVAGGKGTYAYILHDCSGNPTSINRIHYKDVGAEVSHQFKAPLKIGAKSGLVEDPLAVESPSRGKNFFYFNPHLAYEGKVFGIGAGAIIFNKRLDDAGGKILPSLHLRAGDLNKVYFSLGVFENLPFYSGGGYADAGLGFVPTSRTHFWLGASGGPYDRLGFLGKTNFNIHRNWQLNFVGRYGISEGVDEWGMAGGLTYNLIRR